MRDSSPNIDFIIGHHAHVVQPIQNIDGEWLVYGLGNLVSGYTDPARQDELLQVEVTENTDGSFSSELRAVPVYLDQDEEISEPLAARLDASWDRVRTVLESVAGFEAIEIG